MSAYFLDALQCPSLLPLVARRYAFGTLCEYRPPSLNSYGWHTARNFCKHSSEPLAKVQRELPLIIATQ